MADAQGHIQISPDESRVVAFPVLRGRVFKSKVKPLPTTRIVIHESVTISAQRTERVLMRKGYGVHLMVDELGQVIQHNPLTDRVIHAQRFNVNSVGLEVVNPYYEDYQSAPWDRVIDAPWAHKKRYVVPTFEQCRSLVHLVDALTGWRTPDVALELKWPGLRHLEGGRRQMCMQRIPRLHQSVWDRGTGIWAHGYTAHADGAFPTLVCYLALRNRWFSDHIELDIPAAYERAIELATNAKRWVEVS